MLARVRAASAAVRRAIVLALLALVHVLVLGPFALHARLFRRPARGWLRRGESGLATLERLRRPY